jgi:hypothetical protein
VTSIRLENELKVSRVQTIAVLDNAMFLNQLNAEAKLQEEKINYGLEV